MNSNQTSVSWKPSYLNENDYSYQESVRKTVEPCDAVIDVCNHYFTEILAYKIGPS